VFVRVCRCTHVFIFYSIAHWCCIYNIRNYIYVYEMHACRLFILSYIGVVYIYIYILFTIIYVYKTHACRYADLVAEQKLVAQGVEKATKVPLYYIITIIIIYFFLLGVEKATKVPLHYIMLHNYIIICIIL
jgi:hypothetical protein